MITRGGDMGPDPNYFEAEKLPWFPWLMDGVTVKPCKIDTAANMVIVFLRAPAGKGGHTHYHHGHVTVYTIAGQWRYLEHDWIARAGDVVYEAPGSIHTFETLGDEDTIVFLELTGDLDFKDANGNTVHVLSARTLADDYRAYCKEAGIEPIGIS
ncbi:MAG: 2,4'-dihydroxyacetophenone dioxygenase family protein [Acetobacteraceae bacterium]|nr:2,4'-dihydroxyacetophenone dioxygenase family protein [Acetobacteraceae bacterium]